MDESNFDNSTLQSDLNSMKKNILNITGSFDKSKTGHNKNSSSYTPLNQIHKQDNLNDISCSIFILLKILLPVLILLLPISLIFVDELEQLELFFSVVIITFVILLSLNESNTASFTKSYFVVLLEETLLPIIYIYITY